MTGNPHGPGRVQAGVTIARVVGCTVLAAGLVVGLTACGASAHPSAQVHVEASWAKGYRTLDELSADSKSVAVVQVDGSLGAADHDTLYDTTVVTAERGATPDHPRVLLGTSDTIGSDGPADPLRTGHRYLLFLNQFEYQHGQPTGQWVVTGGTGVYEVTDTGLDLLPGGANEGLPAHLDAVPEL